jgi:hypothetical protein
MVAGDNIIEVNSTAAPVDITLPPSATVIRKKYTVKWISGGNTVRVLPNGADVIDYALPSFTLGTLYDSVDFILDRNGTGFIRI